MQELSVAEGGTRRRDFADVVWQIAECRGCDEVVIRYDCGHIIAADVWAPSLPRTRDYGSMEAERRRFMQHSLYVLTKDPGAPKVQIAVPEGRCRHCGRGQRQVLICGPLQMDLSEDRQRGGAAGGAGRPAASARRLELPLSSHAFLAAMGQVCRMPENIAPPPLVRGGLTRGAVIRPFDGPPLPREGVRQWTRREVEEELRTQLARFEGGAACALLCLVMSGLSVLALQLGLNNSANSGGIAPGNFSAEVTPGAAAAVEANASQALGALALAAQALKEAAPAPEAAPPEAVGAEGGSSSLFWSLLVRPAWAVLATLLAPLLWLLDLAVAVPRFLLLDVCLGLLRSLILQPCSWLLGFTVEVASGASVFLFRCVLLRPGGPTAVLSQIPVTNPMAVSLALSVLVAALSAPQPPSLSLPSLWGELPNLEIAKGLRRAASGSKSLAPLLQRLRMLSLWASARKDRRQKGGGARGVPAARGQKERDRSEKKSDAPGKAEKPQAGQKEGKAPSASSHQQQSAPACFVCLDRPSRYILEPCGHRVVCEECAVQLVENAVRSRSASEAGGGAHHAAERGGGACPLCGLVITRAMRLFS